MHVSKYSRQSKKYAQQLKMHSKVWDIFDNWKTFKNEEKCCTLKALFVLKIFRFLSWLFGHVEKTARLER